MIEKQQQANADYVKGMKYKDIAEKYGVSINTVKSWKKRYDWQREKGAHKNKKGCTQNKGAPKGNKNAEGNGAPPGNQNALKHGLFSRYMPEETLAIMNVVACQQPEDLIWIQIEIQFAAIIRAQKIMYVTSDDDKTEDIKSRGDSSTSWQIQYAWDKQANFIRAQSRAMSEFRSLIKQFIELSDPYDERRLKLKVLQNQVEKSKTHSESNNVNRVLGAEPDE